MNSQTISLKTGEIKDFKINVMNFDLFLTSKDSCFRGCLSFYFCFIQFFTQN